MKKLLALLLLTGCSHYADEQPLPQNSSYMIISVDAKHLDYSCAESFMMSMTLNQGYVGHAWLCLNHNGMCIEGGHSGERGITQPRYCDMIQNNLDYGYPNPTEEQKQHPRFEPNPIKCLWENQNDGFFQRGSGNHRATYAVYIPLDDATAAKIQTYIQAYPFHDYSLIGNQCTSFCAQAAAIAGLELEDQVTLPIEQFVKFKRCAYKLWEDPLYNQITFPSPDVLEKSLKKAVKEHKAIYIKVK
jgi:hypothetical protein